MVMMNNFLIVVNRQKDKTEEVTKKVQDYLRSRGKLCHVAAPLETDDPVLNRFTDMHRLRRDIDYDCIIVIGGDGTFLNAVSDFGKMHIPMVGVNLGTLGFLAAIDLDRLEEGLDALIEGRFKIEDRLLIKGTVYKKGKKIGEKDAFNDIVVSRSGFSRLVELKILVNDNLLDVYAADGVIVSTPTGSTGYNLSAGGPVIFPESQMMVITPISPFALSARSVVVPASCKIRIEVGYRKKTQREEAMATFDGNHAWDLESSDVVEIVQDGTTVPIVMIQHRKFTDILREKRTFL